MTPALFNALAGRLLLMFLAALTLAACATIDEINQPEHIQVPPTMNLHFERPTTTTTAFSFDHWLDPARTSTGK